MSLKTHRRILRVEELAGNEVDIVLEKITSSLPAGVSVTIHDEKTEPLSEELLRLLVGGKRLSGVNEYSGVNPLLHRWISVNFENRIKHPLQ